MGVRFACHACGKQLNIKQELAGRRGVCPDCATQFRIPERDAEKSIPLEIPSQAKSEVAAHEAPATVATSNAADPIAGKKVGLIENDPEATWYVRPPSGGQYGPADGALLKQWIGEGRVAATALIWRDGWAQWRPADEALPEIAEVLPGGGNRINGNGGGAAIFQPSPKLAPTVPIAAPLGEDAVQVAGQSGIGADRRNRSFQRIFWIAMLSMIAICLAALLFYLVNRPVA